MLTLGDNKIVAFSRAMIRCERLLHHSFVVEDDDEADVYLERAVAIAKEWDMATDLWKTLVESAMENFRAGRPSTVE